MKWLRAIKVEDVKIGNRFLIADGDLESVSIATVIGTRAEFSRGKPMVVLIYTTPRIRPERDSELGEFEESFTYSPSDEIEILNFYGATECEPARVFTL